MNSMMDACFMCTTDKDCNPVDDTIISQVEYLLPEITVIKLDVRLHICGICKDNLNSFKVFKQIWVENTQRLEAAIKTTQQERNHDTLADITIKQEHHETNRNNSDLQLHTEHSFKDIVINNHYKLEHPELIIKQEEDIISDIVKSETKEQEFNVVKTDDSTETSDSKFEEVYITENFVEGYDTDNKTVTKLVESASEFCCSLCKKIFSTKPALYSHMIIHNETKDYECKICNKTFLSKNGLKAHMQIHDGIKDFKCSRCDKSFLRRVGLQIHEKTHTGIKDLPCSICNRLFSNKSNLRMHMKTHLGVREHKCSVCQKAFTRNSHLTVHMRIHNQSHHKTHLGMKDLSCPLCNKQGC